MAPVVRFHIHENRRIFSAFFVSNSRISSLLSLQLHIPIGIHPPFSKSWNSSVVDYKVEFPGHSISIISNYKKHDRANIFLSLHTDSRLFVYSNVGYHTWPGNSTFFYIFLFPAFLAQLYKMQKHQRLYVSAFDLTASLSGSLHYFSFKISSFKNSLHLLPKVVWLIFNCLAASRMETAPSCHSL